MALSQAEAAQVLNEYLDQLDRAEKEGPSRFEQAFAQSPAGVGVHLRVHQCVLCIHPFESVYPYAGIVTVIVNLKLPRAVSVDFLRPIDRPIRFPIIIDSLCKRP